MPIPRPKILTRVTVPTGGWAFNFRIVVDGSGNVDEVATIPAGDYFVSGDGQTDDLLYQLALKATDEINNNNGGAGADFSDAAVICWIDKDSHKVKILFDGVNDTDNNNDVTIQWSTGAADLAAALGFDSSADDASTSTDDPIFTADWHHGYGWYADEDGYLESLTTENVSVAESTQAVAVSGKIKTQKIAERHTAELRLAWMTRAKTYSADVDYGSAPVYPYERNEGLECWWQEAQQGIEFRVYRDGYVNTSRAADGGTGTGNTGSTMTDSGKAWDTEPQRFKGALLYIGEFGDDANQEAEQTWHIASHTADTLTITETAQSTSGSNRFPLDSTTTYYIFDHQYDTYVVDIQGMSEFAPEEIPVIDRYNMTIPLRKFVS